MTFGVRIRSSLKPVRVSRNRFIMTARTDLPNRGLVGVPGGRALIETPALVIDLELMERNLAAMAHATSKAGLALRPHAKTHKCAEIARRQRAHGAVGICVAKLGEAEVLANAGVKGLLITSPVVTARGHERLCALVRRAPDTMAVVDHPDIARALSAAAAKAGVRVNVLVDVNVGLSRTGASPDGAAALCAQIANDANLMWRGLQGYAGHVQHIEDTGERREKSLAALSLLREVRDVLAAEGLVAAIISGGGTGTFDIDAEAHVFTELQAGSYAVMDRQYADVWTKGGGVPPFAAAMMVATTVISANVPGLATTDAGLKAFATEAGPPVIASGAPEGSKYFFFGDEQGGVILPPGEKLSPGARLYCHPPHCDPTVNLYDVFHVVSGDRLVALWPIEARGRGA